MEKVTEELKQEQILEIEIPSVIPTGFSDFDEMIGGGFKKGEMIVLAARPSIGKTALALNMIRNIVMKKDDAYSVVLFSLEMSEKQVVRRMISTEAQVPYISFLDGSFRDNERQKIEQAEKELSKAKLYIDHTRGITLSELEEKSRKLKEEHDIDLIVIDYLQLVRVGESVKSGREAITLISGGIKKLAKDLDIPILVLAQVNREVEKGVNPKAIPKLSHLRDSVAIEQDADVIVFLHRNRDESQESPPTVLDAKLLVEKNRNGETGVVDLFFHPRLMEFCPVEHKYKESERR